MRYQNYIIGAVIALTIIFLLLEQNVSFDNTARSIEPKLIIGEQKTINYILIQDALMPAPGFVAVFQNLNGKPGLLVGVSAYFPAGDNTSLVVLPNDKLQIGQTVMAAMYQDDGDKVFDQTKDRVAVDSNDKVVFDEMIVVNEISQ